jgi:hypothetical protein
MSKIITQIKSDVINYLLDLKMEENIQNIIDSYKKQSKKELANILIDEKIKLLQDISLYESIDFEYLKTKYLKEKELMSINNVDNTDIKSEEETILSKVDINNESFYYEAKENGKIYNKSTVQVGIYKNNQFIFEN